jgi:hypothetical protein
LGTQSKDLSLWHPNRLYHEQTLIPRVGI